MLSKDLDDREMKDDEEDISNRRMNIKFADETVTVKLPDGTTDLVMKGAKATGKVAKRGGKMMLGLFN